MSIFGWSYPAGCNSTPYDDFGPEECPVCKKPNWDEQEEKFIHVSRAYCSDDCEARDLAEMKAQADAEYQAWEETRVIFFWEVSDNSTGQV
jgi:endogenous inhibitor of DNA gyrase (YacG/DUF329 family)